MLAWVIFAIAAVTTIVMLPFVVMLSIIGIASYCYRRSSHDPLTTTPHFTILVPAWNAAQSIVQTLQSIQRCNYPASHYRIVVVADGCTDQTAALAKAEGVEVWEQPSSQRTVGYTLEFAFKRIQAELAEYSTDAVVVIEAQSMCDPHFLEGFAKEVIAGHDWIQGYVSVHQPDASWHTQLWNYNLALLNGTWLAGQQVLRMGVALRGNAMCFTLRGLARVPWNGIGLSEDRDFSWRLRLNGERVVFCEEARVFRDLWPLPMQDSCPRVPVGKSRRMIRETFTPLIINDPHLSRWERLLYLGDLWSVPDGVLVSAWCVAVLAHVASGHWYGLFAKMQLWYFLGLSLYGLSPFWILGMPVRYLRSVRFIPRYVWWKLQTISGRRKSRSL